MTTVFNHNGGIVRVRTAEGTAALGEKGLAFSAPSRVLIIDDDRGPRESVRFILKYDYEVHTAASMREGIDRMAAAAPTGGFDAIVLDVRMPERSGIEGLDDIRKLDRDVSVIMFTGYATLDVACEAFRHLANDFVAKPPDADALLHAVARNVAATRARRRQSGMARELEDMNKRLTAEIDQSRTLAALGLASDELIHDMNSPLTVLTCCVEMLQMQISRLPQAPNRQWDEMLQYIQTIKNAVTQCVRLADHWRESRQDASVPRSPQSLPAFLRENADVLRPVAAASQIALEIDLTALDPATKVEMDATQLARVIHNLVTNAIRACNGMRQGWVLLRGRSVGNGACEIDVVDNGCGIAPEDLDGIFQPYYSTRSGNGNGLGLAICKRIVEDHGGGIGIETALGQGSTFTVRLPSGV
ncbi:MAG: hybrid sensor histidine kinase/response regulator [Verrucomicrobia bacterium]|nr:hybrid sensor histidine kinase/response regulator [Verrucomicrobiota bacterium]